MHWPQPKRALRQKVPIECFDVSQIENDSVPLWNRPVVNGLIAHDAKEFIGLSAGVQQAGVKVVTNADCCSDGSHGVFPFVWMRLPLEGCADIRRRGAE